MRYLGTAEAIQAFEDALEDDSAHLPVVLDHSDIPWIIFGNEDGDTWAHTIPWELGGDSTITWGQLLHVQHGVPLRVIYDGTEKARR